MKNCEGESLLEVETDKGACDFPLFGMEELGRLGADCDCERARENGFGGAVTGCTAAGGL